MLPFVGWGRGEAPVGAKEALTACPAGSCGRGRGQSYVLVGKLRPKGNGRLVSLKNIFIVHNVCDVCLAHM